ncbi:MAG: hypothetical protein ACYC63_04115 [Armatimonadota bacterium]
MTTYRTTNPEDVKARMVRVWLTWGILPLAASIVLTLLVNALMSNGAEMTAMHLERRFQFILAIGAGLFLIAFSLDSNWTNAQKMAKKIETAAGLDTPGSAGKPKKRPEGRTLELTLAPFANIVIESILASVQALALAGAGIAACAILAAAARLGLSYSIMLLILAASYQLFVLSRHTYYREVMQTALEGKLVCLPDPKSAK